MAEDGINSGGRNIGRFFLAMIPWALGIGALAWLSFYAGVQTVRHDEALERRRAIYTGSVTPPVGKIEIDVLVKDCAHIYKADVDGEDLTLYVKNTCHGEQNYAAYYWQEISTDGTVIDQGYTNQCAIPTQPGDTAECQQKITEDERAKKLRVWALFSVY